MADFAHRALHLLDGDAPSRVAGYFTGNYSGAEWDQWPTGDENHITRLDIASLSLLSITVGPRLMTGDLVGMAVPDVGFKDLRDAPEPDRNGDWKPLYQLWVGVP